MNATDEYHITHADNGISTIFNPKIGSLASVISGMNPITKEAGLSNGSFDISTAKCQSNLKCFDTVGGSYFIGICENLRKVRQLLGTAMTRMVTRKAFLCVQSVSYTHLTLPTKD